MMTRDKELAAIEQAVKRGLCKRYPQGHSSGQAESVNMIFGKPKEWVPGRANNAKARRKSQKRPATGPAQ